MLKNPVFSSDSHVFSTFDEAIDRCIYARCTGEIAFFGKD
jgi:hypothetical protein